MKRLGKIISTVLAASMFLSNAAYAGELADTDNMSAEAASFFAYIGDKISNTIDNVLSDASLDNETSDESEVEEFQDPGMELSSKDIQELYDLGYSMIDIKNAIRLSAESGETPYSILKMKGLNGVNSGTGIDTLEIADTDSNEWNDIKEELGVADETDVDENSDIIFENGTDVEVMFRQLKLDELLQQSGIQESDIEILKNNGLIVDNKNANASDELNDDDMSQEDSVLPHEMATPMEIHENLGGVELYESNTQQDEVSASINGYVYPKEKYNREKTSGYVVENGYDINPVSGNLTVVENDLSLKGVNGLDLNLNRVYSSERSNMMEPSAWTPEDSTDLQFSFLMVRATAEIKVYDNNSKVIKKSDSNVVLAPIRQYNGYNVYTPVDYYYVKEQIQNGIVSNLCKTQSEANNVMNEGYDGEYDKEIRFSSGEISKIEILIYTYPETIFTEKESVIPNPRTYYTTSSYIDVAYKENKPKSFSDLGLGWEFDFPYIEIKEEPYMDENNNYSEITYEYLHYGTKGTWYFDEYGDNYSNLYDYKLEDIVFVK